MSMVIEHAILKLDPDRIGESDEALAGAIHLIKSSPGCRSVKLTRSIEFPGTYVLLIEWDSIEDHTVGFRGSEVFATWRANISPFFVADPMVDHLEVVATA
jgi:heme-degrading monooxygenase HmoA